jgi:hypothetical protein
VWHLRSSDRRRLTACEPSEDLGLLSDDMMDGKHHMDVRIAGKTQDDSGPRLFGRTRAFLNRPQNAALPSGV